MQPRGDLIRIADEALTLGAFRLTATGLVVRGRPSFDDWQECGLVLQRFESGVQFWIGDWLNYGAARKDYGDKYDDAIAIIDRERPTLRDYAYVAQSVSLSRRRDNLSFSVHREVAPLDPGQQKRILDRASKEQLTVSAVRELVRRDVHTGRVAAIERGALPVGEYDVFAADPPWQYDNSGFHQSAAAHYPTMATDVIAALPTTDATFPKCADPCVLFLWATSPLLPAAVAVLQAWGFDYKAHLVWVKDRAPGVGWWLQTRHELLLIGVRGATTPLEKVDSVIAGAVDVHSRKPDEAFTAIDRMFPGLRRVELFARTRRPGWDAWGHEV